MAVIKMACPDCGKDIELVVSQNVIDDELRWYESLSCPNCGNVTEADGKGFPSEEIRGAILIQEGKWDLIIPDSETRKTEVLKVLRKALDWSMADVAQFSKHIPGVVITGTRAEVEWLKKLLLTQGLRAEAGKSKDNTTSGITAPEIHNLARLA